MDRFDWIEIETPQRAPGARPALEGTQPMDGETFYRAARRMRQAGHFRSASEFYEKAVGFDEHHYAAWVEWIDTLVRARQLGGASDRAKYAMNSFRQVRILYAAQALVYLHAGDFDEAQRHLDVGMDTDDVSWYALCVQAELELRKGGPRYQEALMWLEKATDAARSPWDVYFIGGWMLLDANFPTLAAGYFAEAGHCNPRAPIAWMCLGDCFQILGLHDQAIFYYQRVLELEPTHDLAFKREKECAPKLFGLMKVFRRATLHDRWEKEFERIKEEGERYLDEF